MAPTMDMATQVLQRHTVTHRFNLFHLVGGRISTLMPTAHRQRTLVFPLTGPQIVTNQDTHYPRSLRRVHHKSVARERCRGHPFPPRLLHWVLTHLHPFRVKWVIIRLQGVVWANIPLQWEPVRCTHQNLSPNRHRNGLGKIHQSRGWKGLRGSNYVESTLLTGLIFLRSYNALGFLSPL